MNLLGIYKEKNKDKEWFDLHSTLSKGAFGRMFEYTNTNYRTQNSFITQFVKFLEVENKPRSEWPRGDHGQEVHKQHVINMIQSKLFKKKEDETYTRTAKGFLYSEFINSEISDEERWFINYLFLLNGYYFN
ncbi:MAG: hypothetical protein WC894_06350, partial [Patescibacteria group bacterium]